ncbi:hypothetical protein ACFJIV_12670 [Mucilaginibacter sp. UC70_90]
MAKRNAFTAEIVSLLNRNILTNTPFQITWDCIHCKSQHTGDLLKKVQSIKVNDIDGTLQLMDDKSKLFAVICISKNKTLNKKVADSYLPHDAIFIQIDPTGNATNITASIQKPKHLNVCLNPICIACGQHMQQKSLLVIDSNCWKCSAPMKVAVLDCDGYYGGPDRFSPDELALARNKGAIIQTNYSKTVEDYYLSNTCPACNNFAGDHFLFTDNYCAAMYGDLAYERVDLGFGCQSCPSDVAGVD